MNVNREKNPEAWEQIEQGKTCVGCGAWLGALGLEPTPTMFIGHLVDVFMEVHRVLRSDGSLYVNIGDGWFGDSQPRDKSNEAFSKKWDPANSAGKGGNRRSAAKLGDLKPKDLIGIPWMLAFALREAGWWLREEIIWHKKNAMPSSARDRCTRAHEQIFHFTKARTYFYDKDAISEPYEYGDHPRNGNPDLSSIQAPGQPAQAGFTRLRRSGNKRRITEAAGDRQRMNTHMGTGIPWNEQENGRRNKRSVWSIPTSPFPGPHFAVYPPKLVEPMILAVTSEAGACKECGAPYERITERIDKGYDGSVYGERVVEASGGLRSGGTDRSTLGSPGGTETGETRTLFWHPTCKHCPGEAEPCTVLDPFSGAGTTGLVACRLGRRYIGIELSEAHAKLGADRIVEDAPLLNRGEIVEL